MPPRPRKANLAMVVSLPAGILVATLVWSGLGWQLSVWTFLIGLLVPGMVWAVLLRLRKPARPVPEPRGTAWRAQYSGGDDVSLLGVAFVDAAYGWAVGDAGTILATADGGETWNEQVSGSRAELNAVAFADRAHGWAVGNDESGAGTILSTSDGGVAWVEQATSASILCDLAFADARRGWVVGGDGTILATADGGETWTAQDSGGTTSLLGVTFVDPLHGWAVGVDNETADGVILATADGGDTWDAQDSGSRATLRAVAFPDASRGWAVGEAGAILATSDGGVTWSAQSLERLEGKPQTPTLYDVAFPDASHGWAVGYDGDGERGVMLTTANGGATWTGASGRGGLYAVSFPDASHGWAAGYGYDASSGSDTGAGIIFTATQADGTP